MIERLSERKIINRIQQQSERMTTGLVKGIGDDCAVFQFATNRLSLVTTDSLVEGVHFDVSWHPPYQLGRKTASVNISDIAAMGGAPRFALLAMGVPARIEKVWLEKFIDGFLSVLDEHKAVLIGGDTVKSTGPIVCTVTVIGEGDASHTIYRNSARPGDDIWVTGTLGDAAAGLELCRQHDSTIVERWPELVCAHLDPKAEVELGFLLAQSGLVHAMMDISDGLATDLAHICKESQVRAQILADQIPLSESLCAVAREFAVLPSDWALKGGEDYRLLFTAAPAHRKELKTLVRERTGRAIFCLGEIMIGEGVSLLEGGTSQEISFHGYDHFSTTP